MVNKRDSKHLRNKYKLHKPEEIKSPTGTPTVTEAGELTVGAIDIAKVITLPESPASVVAMADINTQGYTLVQSPEAACLVKEDKVIELVPEKHGMYRLPVSTTTKAVGVEVQRAIGALHAHTSERARVEALSHHIHGHSPKCPGCPECVQAKMQQGDGVRGPLQPRQDLEVGFDIVGPLVKSPDSNQYKLVGVCTDTGVGWAVGMPDRHSSTVLRAVQVALARIRLLHKDSKRATVRFHSDVDKSFQGAVQEPGVCQRKGMAANYHRWVRQQ